MDWELASAIAAFISVLITLYLITRKNIKEFALITAKVTSNEENITKLKAYFDRELFIIKENCELKMEIMRKEREERVKAVYEDISDLKKTNSEQHTEAMKEIRVLIAQVNKLNGIIEQHLKQ